MDFFYYFKTGSFNERLNLFSRLNDRKPILALGNPGYEHKLRTMLLAGEHPEPFRNRCRISDSQPSTMKTYHITGKNRSERRLFDRFPSTGLGAHLIAPDFELESVGSVDISLGGISVTIPNSYQLALGDTVGLALYHGAEQVLISGSVANVRVMRGHQVIGIKFEPAQVIEQEPLIKSLILKCIEEKKGGQSQRNRIAA